MTFEEFYSLCSKLAHNQYYASELHLAKDKDKDDETFHDLGVAFKGKDFPLLYTEWVYGSYSGGSCWGIDEDEVYRNSNDEEPDFELLDALLNEIYPSITFLQYKTLTKTLVERDDYRDYEYYGNYTDRNVKYIKLKDLYEYLCNNSFL